MNNCYMCSNEANTKEHVPPKCLFPEAKDVEGNKDYRRNLITVPSCKEHNNKKSDDDQYLLFCLAVNYVTNDVAENHFATKIRKAMERSKKFYGEFYKIVKPVTVVDEHGKSEDSIAISLDRNRFDIAIDHISRAIYYHENSNMFDGSIQVITDSILVSNEISVRSANIIADVQSLLVNTPWKGDNPDVFTYKMKFIDINNSTYCILKFYDGITILSIMTHQK